MQFMLFLFVCGVVSADQDHRYPQPVKSRSAAEDYTGWWYTPGASGTGISIEVQNDMLFLAWYTYDDQGRCIWHTSGGKMDTEAHFSGDLMEWEGWPLEAMYTPPQATGVGGVELNFIGSTDATLAWTLGSSQSQKAITKFMDDMVSGPKDPRDIHGWWYDPGYEGMGLFIEARGGMIFLAWFHYREDCSPRWWSAGGVFSHIDTDFAGTLREYGFGQCIGGPYKSPVAHDIDTFTIGFADDGTAALNWQGTTYRLERFEFGRATMITPYVNSWDVNAIYQAFSSDATAPWGFEHNGIDFSPIKNLIPFRAVFSGVIGRIDKYYNPGNSNWQINIDLRHGDRYWAGYAFEPMSSSESAADYQLSNITVLEGERVTQGDVIGYLYAPDPASHVHFGFYEDNVAVCPEEHFTPEAVQSILNIIRKNNPGWNMCY